MIAAFIFVFVPTIGEFVTPQLVGGPSSSLFGNAIQDQFTHALDWQTGSVFAFFLLFVVAAIMASSAGSRPDRNVQRPDASSRRLLARMWSLRVFFVALVVFLYLPLVVLVVFSFNKRRRDVPAAALHDAVVLSWRRRTRRC